MEPSYYRCCWHEVCSSLFLRYRQLAELASSLRKAVYNPRAFILHAASLDQAFAHCRIFSTAATRRCMTRIAVSSLGAVLSHPLPVIALVSFYLTNKLIGHRLLLKRRNFKWECLMTPHYYRVLSHLSVDYSRPRGRLPMRYSPVCHAYPKVDIRLACLSHAASVHPEPGSNSRLR